MDKVTDLLKQGFRVSVELVPSMIDREGHPTLERVLSVLDSTVQPSFISVTQGSGGTSREQSPFLLSRLADRKLCAHLICGYAPRTEVLRHAANFYAMGIRNFLVLLGDPPIQPARSISSAPSAEIPATGESSTANRSSAEIPTIRANSQSGFSAGARGSAEIPATGAAAIGAPGDYLHAVDCVRELRAKYSDLCIGVAAYPDATDINERIHYLREKQKAGANFAITQMLFSADTYRTFIKELALPNFPVLPGLCFIHDESHAKQFAKRFGVQIPWPLKPMRDLITDFQKAGAPGVHLFALNDIALIEREL